MADGATRTEAFLLGAQLMIENAISDSEVMAALANYGYSEEKLLAGKQLYDLAAKLFTQQKMEYGDQVAATAEVESAWEAADKQYIRTLRIARLALSDNVKADKAAMMYGRRKQSLSGWLEQARAFYTNILGDSEFLTSLAGYGYTPEKLQAEAASLDRIVAKQMQQKKEMGEAQKATEVRDKALDDLAKYISDLRAVAKIALEDDRQQLEKLGILARTKA